MRVKGGAFCGSYDVNVMVDWVITLPQSLNDKGLENEDRFFREAYKFLNDRYGKENVISAYVHMERVFGRDIGILNEATKEGNKSIEELKKGMAQEKLKIATLEAATIISKAQDDIKPIEEHKRAIQSEIEGLQRDRYINGKASKRCATHKSPHW